MQTLYTTLCAACEAEEKSVNIAGCRCGIQLAGVAVLFAEVAVLCCAAMQRGAAAGAARLLLLHVLLA